MTDSTKAVSRRRHSALLDKMGGSLAGEGNLSIEEKNEFAELHNKFAEDEPLAGVPGGRRIVSYMSVIGGKFMYGHHYMPDAEEMARRSTWTVGTTSKLNISYNDGPAEWKHPSQYGITSKETWDDIVASVPTGREQEAAEVRAALLEDDSEEADQLRSSLSDRKGSQDPWSKTTPAQREAFLAQSIVNLAVLITMVSNSEFPQNCRLGRALAALYEK